MAPANTVSAKLNSAERERAGRARSIRTPLETNENKKNIYIYLHIRIYIYRKHIHIRGERIVEEKGYSTGERGQKRERERETALREN